MENDIKYISFLEIEYFLEIYNLGWKPNSTINILCTIYQHNTTRVFSRQKK